MKSPFLRRFGMKSPFVDNETGAVFSPSILFALAEPGVWYDPSDLTTLFQDTAGTLPVTTPGQTVALALDKSKGLVLGPELVVNGTFDTNLSGWTATPAWTWDAGEAKGVLSSSGDTLIQTFATLAPGWVEFKYRVVSGSLRCAIRGADGIYSTLIANSLSGTGTFRAFTAQPFDGIQFARSGAGTMYVDNVSVKQLPGNHATQATTASRPIYGINPVGGTRNLLLQTENYTITNIDATNSAYSGALPVGTQSARQIRETATTAGHAVRIGSPTFTGAYTGQLTFTIRVLPQGRSRVQVLPERVGATEWAGSTFNLTTNTATNTIVVGGQSLTSSSVSDANDGWKIIRVTYTPTTSITGLLFCLLDDVVPGSTTAPSYAGDVSKGVAITGMQLETGSTATAYQKVTTQYDVTEAGVASVSYLAFDGVDDFLITPTITPGIDRAQVFAGVRKLSDVAVSASNAAVIAEFGNAVGNNFVSLSGSTGFNTNQKYSFLSKGTSLGNAVTTSSTYSAPVTNVVTGLGDISGDRATLRLNGVQVGQATSDQGTGNYAANVLYIGRRGGASLPFNGNLYSLIVRFGTNLTTDTITSTETWVNGKTGAY